MTIHRYGIVSREEVKALTDKQVLHRRATASGTHLRAQQLLALIGLIYLFAYVDAGLCARRLMGHRSIANTVVLSKLPGAGRAWIWHVHGASANGRALPRSGLHAFRAARHQEHDESVLCCACVKRASEFALALEVLRREAADSSRFGSLTPSPRLQLSGSGGVSAPGPACVGTQNTEAR